MEINYVCSLGSFCHNARILQSNNLKNCSYPFDWIFTNYDIIIDCIEDNFNIFLDKSYYISLGNQQCGHKKYHERFFNHHNPLINENDYNYYIRCIDRFKKLLQYEEHKLFTMLFIMDRINDTYENFKNNIIDFNNKFSKHTHNYTLLVILNIPNKEVNNHIFTYNDNIHFLELHTLSRSNGTHFDNKDDNIYLNNLIKETYNFKIKC